MNGPHPDDSRPGSDTVPHSEARVPDKSPDKRKHSRRTSPDMASEDPAGKLPVVPDEELKKTERNPESNPGYVQEQIRQEDA